jgi:hypothetical protein
MQLQRVKGKNRQNFLVRQRVSRTFERRFTSWNRFSFSGLGNLLKVIYQEPRAALGGDPE